MAEGLSKAAQDAIEKAVRLGNSRVTGSGDQVQIEGVALYATKETGNGKKRMQAEVRALKSLLSQQTISQESYYRRLEELRNTYLTRGSKEWWQYTKDILYYENQQISQHGQQSQQMLDDQLLRLEQQKKYGILSNEEYYQQLSQLRDRFLQSGEEGWEDYTKKVEEYQGRLFQKQQQAISELYQEITKLAAEEVAQVEEDIQSLEQRLSHMSSLYRTITIRDVNGKITDRFYTPFDLDAKAKQLEEYGDLLQRFGQAVGENSPVMEEVLSLSTEEAVTTMETLLKMPEEELSRWLELYDEVRARSQELATDAYQTQMEEAEEMQRLADELGSSIEQEFDRLGVSVPEGFLDMGKQAASKFYEGFSTLQSLIEGLLEEMGQTVGNLGSLTPTSFVEAREAAQASMTYAPTYHFATSGESVATQIQAANHNDQVNRLRGNL